AVPEDFLVAGLRHVHRQVRYSLDGQRPGANVSWLNFPTQPATGCVGHPGIVMCRNIKTLFNFDPPVTDDEVRAASLQFVRKITGLNKPSKANEEAFQAAIDEIGGI